MPWILQNWAIVLTTVGGVCVVVGSLATALQQNKQADEVAALNAKIVEKSEKIEELSEKNLSAVTGGAGYCYAAISHMSDGKVHWFVVNLGEFPIYDVSVRVVDPAEVRALGDNLTLEKLASVGRTVELGTLAPKMSKLVGNLGALKGASQAYTVNFFARNGHWTQQMRFRLVDEIWAAATKVVRDRPDSPSEVLYQKIDDTFPKNASNEVDWN